MTTDTEAQQIIRDYESERGTSNAAGNAAARIAANFALARSQGAAAALNTAADAWPGGPIVPRWLRARARGIGESR